MSTMSLLDLFWDHLNDNTSQDELRIWKLMYKTVSKMPLHLLSRVKYGNNGIKDN